MNTVIIIIILIILAVIFRKRYIEGFADYNPNMLGYEEGLPKEYRWIDYKTLEYNKKNKKEITGNNWHLRFPYMVPIRYSYNDTPDRYYDIVNYGKTARLKELPLQMEVDQNYIPLSKHNINFQKSDAELPCDLHQSYIDSNRFLDSRWRQKEINGFDYNNNQRIGFNTGDGTSDSFYLEDVSY